MYFSSYFSYFYFALSLRYLKIVMCQLCFSLRTVIIDIYFYPDIFFCEKCCVQLFFKANFVYYFKPVLIFFLKNKLLKRLLLNFQINHGILCYIPYLLCSGKLYKRKFCMREHFRMPFSFKISNTVKLVESKLHGTENIPLYQGFYLSRCNFSI